MSGERDRATELLRAGVEQMSADITALAETMTPAERAGALHCALNHLSRTAESLGHRGDPTANVLTVVQIEVSALSRVVLGEAADGALDHGACKAMIAIANRMPSLLEQAAQELRS